MAVTGGAAPFLIVIAVLFLVVAILARTRRLCEFFQGSHQYILENPNNCTFEEEREKSQRRNFIYLLDKGICMTNPPHLLTVVKKVCSFITWDGYQYMSNQFGRTNAVALPLKKGAGFELILQQDLHY
uniref:Uncharacterized protein n=1 Tax=Oryza barthii TaxID=65489 RepID=A0A0D3HW49_9ORYZ